MSPNVRVSHGCDRPCFQISLRQGQRRSKRFFLGGCSVAVIGILAVGFAGAGFRTPTGAADKPNSWGFDTANQDKTCKTCDDFYQLAMGGWMKFKPIAPE